MVRRPRSEHEKKAQKRPLGPSGEEITNRVSAVKVSSRTKGDADRWEEASSRGTRTGGH
jgi:hypothetical protein